MIERSLILIKPDGVKRGLVGEILMRFERVGLKIVAAKMVQATEQMGVDHYPSSQEWLSTVGARTIDDCEKYGIDLMANMGTTDAVEIGKIVKQWNVDFLTSGPVMAFVLEGVNAIERVRSLAGSTIPAKSAPGTIRGDYSLDSAIVANKLKRTIYNLIHASGSTQEAEEEIKLWFGDDKTHSYRRVHEDLYSY